MILVKLRILDWNKAIIMKCVRPSRVLPCGKTITRMTPRSGVKVTEVSVQVSVVGPLIDYPRSELRTHPFCPELHSWTHR
jgi:hypothetical protein